MNKIDHDEQFCYQFIDLHTRRESDTDIVNQLRNILSALINLQIQVEELPTDFLILGLWKKVLPFEIKRVSKLILEERNREN
jgi:hypothetical protein